MLPPMTYAVAVNDPAALQAAEEDAIMLELVELGAELVVDDAGALVIGQCGGARPHREVAGGAV